MLDPLREDLIVALLVVTHGLAVARFIAEKFLVMYLGRIVEEAPTELLFNRSLHPYPQGWLTAIPTTEPGRLAPTLAGEPPDHLERHVGCSFAPHCFKTQDRCRWEIPEPRASDGFGDLRMRGSIC